MNGKFTNLTNAILSNKQIRERKDSNKIMKSLI